jgi:hypothetical protein
MDLDKLYLDPSCEVSKLTLKLRLARGEKYAKAKKLRNFMANGRGYRDLQELAEYLKLTYEDALYQVGTLKKLPKDLVGVKK